MSSLSKQLNIIIKKYNLNDYIFLNKIKEKSPKKKNIIDILLLEKKDISIIKNHNKNNKILKFNIIKLNNINWIKNILKNKIRKKFNIIDNKNKYYLLLYLNYITNDSTNYKKIFLKYENDNNLNHDSTSRYYYLFNYITTNNYNVLKKNKYSKKYNLNLFIIRRNGLKENIIKNILKKIEKEYQIIDKIIVTIGNKKKFFEKFYDNYNEYKEDINKSNDNKCIAIITNIPNNKNPNDFKFKIRNEYIDIYPPLGNIIHCSDSSYDCEKELTLLLNENINNFKNVGTYYSKKNT